MTHDHHLKEIHSWDFWDWNAIVTTFLFVFGFFLIIYILVSGPEILRDRKMKKLDKATIGHITYIKKDVMMRQSLTGNTVSLDNIIVSYTYMANGNTFSRKEVIFNNGVTTRFFMHKLLSTKDSLLNIKYSSKDTSKSLIVIEL